MPEQLSTRDIASLLDVELWRVARLFETGTLPEPPRIAGRRAIPKAMIPDIVVALQKRGWIPSSQLEPAS
jgi:hypothetical protein